MNLNHTSINKLCTLSLKEAIFRTKEQLIEKKELFQHKINSKIEYKENKTSILSGDKFFLEECDSLIRQNLFIQLGYKKEILEDADEILTGRVCLLGFDMEIPSGHKWHIDPVTGIKWPFIFYTKLRSNKATKDLDIKYVWEISRHQYLIPLAKAFWLTGQEKYSQAVFSVITDWIDANPYQTGVNWTSSLEHAVRLFSWMWSLNLCKRSNYYKKYIGKIKASVYEQAHHICNHLSIYSSPYNHLVGEAAALYLVGSLYPKMPGAESWEATGWEVLEKNIDEQFHSDGLSVEQACFYHHFTLGFYLTCILLRRINGKDVSKKVLQRIENAIEIASYLKMPDGTMPMKGDIDNARSIYFSLNHSWDFAFFSDLGAVLFHRQDLKDKKAKFPEELLWLLSDDDLELYHSLESNLPALPSRLFENSGYCIMRDSWAEESNYLCFDFGQIAHGLSKRAIPSAAHGHADALSFELSVQGLPFLIDPGFYTYFGDLDWHQHFRLEEAHNTIKIKGYSQAEYCGRLKWQKVKKPQLMKWNVVETAIECAGKIVYEPGVFHQRDIYYQKRKFWIVKDHVETGDGNRSAESYFHFDPRVEVTVNNDQKVILVRQGDVGLLMRVFPECEIQAEKGGSSPESGWVCRGYGMREPAWSLTLKWRPEQCRNYLLIAIVPYSLSNDSYPQVTWSAENESVGIKLQNEWYHACFSLHDGIQCELPN